MNYRRCQVIMTPASGACPPRTIEVTLVHEEDTLVQEKTV